MTREDGHVLREVGRNLLVGDAEEVRRRVLAYTQAGGRCQHQAPDPRPLCRCEHGRHVAAHRVADERDLAEVERVEEVEVVEDVVQDRVDGRVVGRGAEPGMVRDDETAAVREREQRVEAGERPRAVEEDEWVALARR